MVRLHTDQPGQSPSLLQQTVNSLVSLNSDQPGISPSLLQQTMNTMVRLNSDQTWYAGSEIYVHNILKYYLIKEIKQCTVTSLFNVKNDTTKCLIDLIIYYISLAW